MGDQLEVGQTVAGGRYVVEGLVGSGGLADVYKIRQTELGSVYALKVLTLRRKQLTARFEREARFQAQFGHPNVVRVIDFVRFDDGQVAFVMDYVEGPTLEQLLAEQGPIAAQEAFAMFVPILAAVTAAHDRGVLHRDLKPANVLMEHTAVGWVPKVADFGIAKFVTDEMGIGTSTGLAMGSPGYMAPEQVRDSSTVDARADIFALGAILFEMLTGVKAFGDPDGGVSFVSTLEREPPPINVPDLSPEIIAAIRKSISKEREERFPDCRSFARALGIAGHPLLIERRDSGRPLTGPPPLSGSGTPQSSRSGAPSTLDPVAATTVAPPPSSSAIRPAGAGWLVVPLVAGSVAAVGTVGLLVLAVLIWVVGVQGRLPVATAPVSAPVAAPAPVVAPIEVAPVEVAPAEVPPTEPAAVPPVPAPTPGKPVPPVSLPVEVDPVPVEPAPAPVPAPVEPTPVPQPVAPKNDAVAAVEPVATAAPASAKPAPFDPMTVLRGDWSGKAGGKQCAMRFFSADGGVVRGEVRFVAGTEITSRPLEGTYDKATGRLELRGDGKILFQGTVSGSHISGQYSMGGSKMLDWTVDK